MLEVLSIGTIVVASRTGGNKYFERTGAKGIFCYNDIGGACSAIRNLYYIDKEERLNLVNSNKQLFQEDFTLKVFAENYIKLIESL